jgi:hypothetical protein
MFDGDTFLEVEVMITNCSPKTVQIDPKDFRLVVVAPNGDRVLPQLDATRFVQFPKSGKTFPALVSETAPYGRIGVFRTFFARDGNARASDRMKSNYSLRMTIPVESWEFGFNFPRQKTR